MCQESALLQIISITVKINLKVPMRISFDPDILLLENVFFTFCILAPALLVNFFRDFKDSLRFHTTLSCLERVRFLYRLGRNGSSHFIL